MKRVFSLKSCFKGLLLLILTSLLIYLVKIPVSYADETCSKTRSTIFTSQKVANLRANVAKGTPGNTNYDPEYAWAKEECDGKTQKADQLLNKLGSTQSEQDEAIWRLVTSQGLPRAIFTCCPNCGNEYQSYGMYSWIGSALESDPWKLECPNCHMKFPTNDFKSFYESALDEHGNFNPALGNPDYLVNVEYPERGASWGVDNGMGYMDSAGNKYDIIPYYNHWKLWYSGGYGGGAITETLDALREAYIYSGDNKYAHAGLIFLDRIADVYPSMDIASMNPSHNRYPNSPSEQGSIVGCIWECNIVKYFINAYDAFFPAISNSDYANVVAFLHAKAVEKGLINLKSDINHIKLNIEKNILYEIYPGIQSKKIIGNDGMHQSALAMAAVVLDNPGTESNPGPTREWIDFLFKPFSYFHNPTCTGGDIDNIFFGKISRDGFGDEAAPQYNCFWIFNFQKVFDVLCDYDGYPGLNFFDPKSKYYAKIKQSYQSYQQLVLLGKYTPDIGDTNKAGDPNILTSPDPVNTSLYAFDKYGDPGFAQFAYLLNGNSTKGLRGSIYSSDPMSLAASTQNIINKYGRFENTIKSSNLTGYGFTALRDGINYIKNNYGFNIGFKNSSLVSSSGKIFSAYSNESFMYNSIEMGDYIQLDFNVPESDTYELDIGIGQLSNAGKYDIYIDDQIIKSNFDFFGYYSKKISKIAENLYFSSGSHRIKFVCSGKNNLSDGYIIKVNSLYLLNSAAQAQRSNDQNLGDRQRAVSMYFGRGGSRMNHGHADALSIWLHAFGLDLAPDSGYVYKADGMCGETREWDCNTISHNTVVVDGKKQRDSDLLFNNPSSYYNTQVCRDKETGIPYNYDDSDFVKIMDVNEPGIYSNTSLYRRSVAMIKVDDINSYTVDFFRVKGGNDHYYSFHGAYGTVSTSGLNLVPQKDGNGNYIGTYKGANVPYPTDPEQKSDNDNTQYYESSGFQWLYDVDRANNPQGAFSVDWNINDNWGVLDQQEDIHLRLTMLNGVNDVAIAKGQPPQNKAGNPPYFNYLIAHKSGTNLESQFVSVIEPYKDQRYISSITSVAMTTQQQGVSASDAAAVKVVLDDGTVQYIMNSIDPDVLYLVDNRFEFKGSFAVYSESGSTKRTYISNGSYLKDVVSDKIIIKKTYGSVTGKVKGFTKLQSNDNEITVLLDEFNQNLNDLVGRYMYIDTDDVRNGTYQIKEIKKVKGKLVSFGIGEITLIRGYVDYYDHSTGLKYDIQNDADVSIPISDVLPKVTLSSNGTRMLTGQTIQLTAGGIGWNDQAVDLTGKNITFTSSDASIATVNGSGLVTGISTGKADISVSVTINGVATSNKITVYVYSAGLTLSKIDLSQNVLFGAGMGMDESGQILVTGTMNDDMVIPDIRSFANTEFTYSSDRPDIVSVSPDGAIRTGKIAGKANISVTAVLNGSSVSTAFTIIVYNNGMLMYDGFENGLSNWTKTYGSPSTSSEKKLSGDYSLKIGNEDLEAANWNITACNGITEEWFYDDGASNKSVLVDNVPVSTDVSAIGIDSSVSVNYYVYRIGGDIHATGIGRMIGWHQVVYDYAISGSYNMYLDGTLVATVSGKEECSVLGVHDHWADNAKSNFYVDDVAVYNVTGTLSNISLLHENPSDDVWYSKAGWAEGVKSLETSNTGNIYSEFDLIPQVITDSATVGYAASGVAVNGYGWDKLAMIIAMDKSQGYFTVRNGSGYDKDATVVYTAGTKYHFKVVPDFTNHTYNVFVTPEGGSQITLAANYAFRSDAPVTNDMGQISLKSDTDGDISIMNQYPVKTINPVKMIRGQAQGYNLKISCNTDNGKLADISYATDVSYSSSNPNIASVDSSGLITAGNTNGNVTITASVTLFGVTKSNTMNITTTDASLAYISLSGNPAGMNVGQTRQLYIDGTMSDGSSMLQYGGAAYTFASDNPSVATVDSSGVVLAKSKGIANITVTAVLNGIAKSTGLTVIVNDGILQHEGFENGMSGWEVIDGSPVISSIKKHSGNNCLLIGGSCDVEGARKYFDVYNEVCEIWFYDDNSMYKKVFLGANPTLFGIGIDTHPYDGVLATRYITNGYGITSVDRTPGWHQAVFDYTGQNTVKIYLDGILVSTVTGPETFAQPTVCDFTQDGFVSKLFVDDISIYDVLP